MQKVCLQRAWERLAREIDKSWVSFITGGRSNPPSNPSWEPRWHSSHFLDNSHNAVGGYSNKGGTAPGYKTLKATDGRDSSGCATIHGFARIETNKGCRESRRHFRVGLRIASDLSRGMQECAIITQRCGPTVLGACWMRDFSRRASSPRVAADY